LVNRIANHLSIGWWANNGWRVRKGWPEPVGKHNHYELKLAKITHWILLVGSVAQPIFGMLASGASGHGFGIVKLITLVPANLVETFSLDTLGCRLPSDVEPYNKYWMNIGYALHTWIDHIMVVAVVLHSAGAFKHHLFDKDSTLKRMLGRG
jgi:Cytochrome B561